MKRYVPYWPNGSVLVCPVWWVSREDEGTVESEGHPGRRRRQEREGNLTELEFGAAVGTVA